ncbi:hypothetical protein [Flavobacterium sp.]|uniref:hypothetical protein n=1 Tax=Flavobacterium sp. TaxID=239 RepID=UPI00286B61C2|nr:hypothetical protein [Flavobacterium sp.]
MGNTAGIFQVSTESIYMLFMALGLYFLRQYFKTNFFWQLSLALSFFITSCLIKPGSIFLAIILTLFFGIKILKKYQSKAIYFIYGSWLLVLMQCAGLKYQFGNFTISYIDAITYYCYLGAKAEAIETNQDFEKVWLERTHFIYNQDPPISKIMAKEDLIEQWQTNKINLGKAYFLNLLENASTGSTPIQDCKNITNKKYFIVSKKVLLGISVWQNIIFSIVAIFLATYLLLACYKSDPYYSIVSFFILYTIFSSGISCSEGDRFNVITFPFVLILMAKCFSKKSTEAAKIYTVR